MSIGKKIAFWILFPIISALISAGLVFYLDLANGPLWIFIVEVIALVIAILARIILRNKFFVFRMIPFLSIVAINFILLPMAKPVFEDKYAGLYGRYEESEPLQLANGKIKGLSKVDEDVEVYAGVPYAKAPLGELRWKEPQPVEDWEGIKDCTHFKDKSMQAAPNPLLDGLVDIYSMKGWHPNWNMASEQKISEDSLYLNIWRPKNITTNLPILMFIHGGSLTSGSSAFTDYNGEEMAKKGIIMITITYRLGIFGYLASQDLIDESSNHTTGNYGLLDQIQALKWVNENAAYFGGDKDNITIAGESAGSSSISAICVSPLASGLFKRAIGESSSLVTTRPPHTFRTLDEALKVGEEVKKEFNVSSIEELRKVDASSLLNSKTNHSGMTLDGYALRKDKMPLDIVKDGESNEESLLNGYNVKEADAFVIPSYLFSPTNKDNIKGRLEDVFGETLTKKIMDVYKDKIEEDAFSAYNEIFSVYWFIYPHHSWSNAMLEAGKPVYRYQFTKYNGYHETYHAGEMIYAYGNIKHSDKPFAYNDSDLSLSDKMSTYWSNYVKTGNPGSDWDLYNDVDKKVYELGEHIGLIDDKYLSLYPIIEEFMNEQLIKDMEK